MIYQKNKQWYDKEIMDGFKVHGQRKEKEEPMLSYESSYDALIEKRLENPQESNLDFFMRLAAGKI